MNIREKLVSPIAHTCDVLVCGGGFAGIAAALSAARSGKRVILLEKTYTLGGLGTAGLVTIYLPLCDGMGQQVSFGIAEELFRLSISMGMEPQLEMRYPDIWLDEDRASERNEKSMRFETQYNPHLFAILAEQLLRKEGVVILYGASAVAVKMKKDKISSVLIEGKSGRQAIQAVSVVDATGDCDIAKFAGARTENFQQGNVLASWYYFMDEKGYHLNILGFADIPDDQKTDADREKDKGKKRYAGLETEELSRMMQDSHSSTMQDVISRRGKGQDVWPVTIASIPQVRMTRKIVGEYTLDVAEEHTYMADSIGMVSDWRKRGPVYEVPFGTLYSKNVKNLITAGRCVSVTESMWDIMRVIPCCAVTGEAAGLAAAMTDDFSTLDVCNLQEELVRRGVMLHEQDLK